MKGPFLLCWLLLASLLDGFAQVSQFIEPVVTLEYGYNTIDPTHINDFFRTHNQFWATQVAEPWDSVGRAPMAHIQGRLGFRAFLAGESSPIGFVAATNVVFGTGREIREMTFTNGTGHVMEMESRDWGWDFHAGVGGEQWYLVGLATAYVRNLDISLYTTFPDGSRSLGNLYKISGIYTGRATTLDVGAGVGYRVGPVFLTGKLEIPLSGFPPGRYLIWQEDYDSSEEVLSVLPRDYNLWATDPVQMAALAVDDDQEVIVLSDAFTGLRVSFGVEITLRSLYQSGLIKNN